MRRIGHRGAKGHAPENTIASFQKALDLGCDEVETDVWLVPDGRMVISHDRPSGEAMLTLEEMLDFCRGRLGVNVELKAEMNEVAAREAGGRVGALLARRAAWRRRSGGPSSSPTRPSGPRSSAVRAR